MRNQRNHALDLLRGLTIALMIIVNNPGDWKAMFTFLRHAEWHGFLGADIVFPLFLFIAGYAAALKIHRVYLPLKSSGPHCASALTLDPAEAPPFFWPLLRRAALLFLIGVFLNAWPFGLLPGTSFDMANLRVMGVLQRIALCVLIGGVILRYATTRLQTTLAIVVLVLLYEICMRLIVLQTPAGLYGGSFGLADNFARFIDTSVLPAAMLYKVKGIPFDPEGLFTTLTATATFLLGGLTYRLGLRKSRWYLVGALAVLSLLALAIEPLNKNLWTTPYVLLTAALGAAALTVLEITLSAHGPGDRRPGNVFVEMGKNPLIVYVLSVLCGKTLATWKLSSGLSLKQYTYKFLAVSSMPAEVQSLLYSVLLLMAMMFLAWLMRRLPLRL
ncbi:MAG: heparan-alpha-glucosaminide N-acetyltransferase domain-containing protein [Spirochaetota bacterium]